MFYSLGILVLFKHKFNDQGKQIPIYLVYGFLSQINDL